MEDPERYPAGDLLQAATAVAAIAIALATLTHDLLMEIVFLLSGIASLAASGYALSVLWQEAGLTWRHLLPRRHHEGLAERYEALLYLAWGMIILGVAYIVLLLRRLQ